MGGSTDGAHRCGNDANARSVHAVRCYSRNKRPDDVSGVGITAEGITVTGSTIAHSEEREMHDEVKVHIPKRILAVLIRK